MTAQVPGIDCLVRAQDLVDLIEVFLGHAVVGDLVQLVPVGQILVARGAVVFADPDGLPAKLGLKLVEFEHHRKAGAVADEQAAVSVENVSARPWHEDPTLGLMALALVIHVGPEQLLVRQAAPQDEQHAADDPVKEQDAGIAALVRLEEGSRIVRAMAFVNGHGRRSKHPLGIAGDEGENPGPGGRRTREPPAR